MTRRRNLLSALATGLLAGTGFVLPGGAHGQVKPAATPPAEVGAELSEAQAGGVSRMRFFGLDICEVKLWIWPGFRAASYAQHPLVLELSYLRSLSGSAIAQRSLQEMRRAGAIAPAQEQRWLVAMQEAFPDVKNGDRLTGLHRPGVGARFWYNGQPRADIRDPEFSRLFFGIWLAESTSEPALRAALLAPTAP